MCYCSSLNSEPTTFDSENSITDAHAMPTQGWREEWWKSNEYHGIMTFYIVAITPPEPQIDTLQTSYIVVKENYMCLNCESAKALMQTSTCDTWCSSHRKLYVIPGKNSYCTHMIFLSLGILRRKGFLNFQNLHTSSLTHLSVKAYGKICIACSGT